MFHIKEAFAQENVSRTFTAEALRGYTIVDVKDCLEAEVHIVDDPDNIAVLYSCDGMIRFGSNAYNNVAWARSIRPGVSFSKTGDGGRIVVRKSDKAAVAVIVGGNKTDTVLCPASAFIPF
jgi:hypothetical protein